MSNEWYLARNGQEQFGPYSDSQLQEYAMSGRIQPNDLLWKAGMADWLPAHAVAGITIPPPMPPSFPAGNGGPPYQTAYNSTTSGNRVACGITGILIGSLGIHKFIIGNTTPALIMLLVTICTLGIGGIPMGIIGLVEGVIYLSKSDEEFHRIYEVGKKSWF